MTWESSKENENNEFILGEESQVFPFLSFVSIVSPLSFLTISLRSEWVKGMELTYIFSLVSTHTHHAKDCTPISGCSLPYYSKCQKLEPLHFFSLTDC